KKGSGQGRHGYIRGWTKTGVDGCYQFFTLRPVVYLKRIVLEHIHAIVKESTINEYYIDEYLFTDDLLFTDEHRCKAENRCGFGIVTLTKNKNGMFVCHRDIILGFNILNY